METSDLTLAVLTSIRDELHEGLSSVRGEIAGLRSELTERVDRVERRQTEADLRVATELVAIPGLLREMRDECRQERALTRRVEDHERRLSAVEKRVGG